VATGLREPGHTQASVAESRQPRCYTSRQPYGVWYSLIARPKEGSERLFSLSPHGCEPDCRRIFLHSARLHAVRTWTNPHANDPSHGWL